MPVYSLMKPRRRSAPSLLSSAPPGQPRQDQRPPPTAADLRARAGAPAGRMQGFTPRDAGIAQPRTGGISVTSDPRRNATNEEVVTAGQDNSRTQLQQPPSPAASMEEGVNQRRSSPLDRLREQLPGGVRPGPDVGARVDVEVDRRSPQERVDDAAGRFVEDMLAGPRDTAAAEAQLRAEQDRLLGQQLVDQRASMGRAGFGSSGAMVGLEGDLRSQAADRVARGVLDEQQRARDEYMERGQAGIDAELDMRDQASEEELNRELLRLLGLEDDGGGDEGGLGEAVAGVAGDYEGVRDAGDYVGNVGEQIVSIPNALIGYDRDEKEWAEDPGDYGGTAARSFLDYWASLAGQKRKKKG